MAWTGTLGAAAFAVAWLPQCWQTLRERRCDVNGGFLLLNAIGSMSLTAYALSRRDLVFSGVNCLTSAGALLNLAFKLAGPRPR